MPDKNIYWSKTGLIGGAATDLDSIDGAGLQDGEIAHVFVAGMLYVYRLDVDSAAAESSPTIIAPDTNAGDKRWILQGSRNIAIGSDADGDMYYRASGVLARLAKGAANLKLFMNAGATAPEWAAGLKHLITTRDMTAATADVAITGVGFKPAAAILLAAINNSYVFSIGIIHGTTNSGLRSNYAGTVYGGQTKALEISTAGGDGQTADWLSWDDDGCTLRWVKSGSPTGTLTINCLFIR